MFSSNAQHKADAIQTDTKMVLDLFELPKTESVIQNYRCAYWKEGDKLPSQGRMFITQRFCCWTASLQPLQLRIELKSISLVHKEKALMGLMSTAMEITSNKIKYHFRTFAGSAKRDEAFTLLEYLSTVLVDSAPPLDGDPFKILLKEPNGQLHRALLLLREDSFAIYDSLGVAQINAKKYGYRKTSWSLKDIESLVLRARPLHIDAKFNDGSQRLRFVCVHARVVVVRLTAYSDALRPIVPVDVDFEPGIEPFDPRGSEEDSETVLARQLAAQTTEVVPTPPVSPPPENTLIDLSEFVDLNADSTATTSPPTSPVSAHNDTVVVPERRRSLPAKRNSIDTNNQVRDEWRRAVEHEDVVAAADAIEQALGGTSPDRPRSMSGMSDDERQTMRQTEIQRRREYRASLRSNNAMNDVLIPRDEAALARRAVQRAEAEKSGCCNNCLLL